MINFFAVVGVISIILFILIVIFLLYCFSEFKNHWDTDDEQP